MKKVLLFVAMGLAIVSCDKSSEVKEAKTAYVDTEKLIKESVEAKDIEEKFKSRAKEMGAQLDQEIARFQADAAQFEKDMQTKGMAWAQQNAPQMQQRKQKLSYEQGMLEQKIRQESGVAMDSMISNMKKVIKVYGKEKGYNYIYEANAILYTDDKNDITKDVIKLVNDKYKSSDKKETATEVSDEKK